MKSVNFWQIGLQSSPHLLCNCPSICSPQASSGRLQGCTGFCPSHSHLWLAIPSLHHTLPLLSLEQLVDVFPSCPFAFRLGCHTHSTVLPLFESKEVDETKANIIFRHQTSNCSELSLTTALILFILEEVFF